MASKITIAESRKGPLGEKEDWWHLVIEDSGTSYIEHEWSHTDPYGKGGDNSGTEKISVDDYLKNNHNQAAVAKVKEHLGKKLKA